LPVQSFCGDNYKEAGITHVVVARKMGDDNYIVGWYLVDIWCLGVKNADVKMNLSQKEVEEMLDRLSSSEQEMVACSYELVRSIILGSVAYAAHIGITPHHDWDRAKNIIEPHRSFENNVIFGYEGKPFYVVGPNDRHIQDSVMQKVTKAGGHWIGEL